MRNYSNGFLILSLIYVIQTVPIFKNSTIHISAAEAKKIGHQIWQNECGGSLEKIIFWNENEAFPSLGIGHNIWGDKIEFKQSFPDLVRFMTENGRPLPPGIVTNILRCPWRTREEFMAQLNSPQMKLLRGYLESTIDLQILYMITKLDREIKKIVQAVPVKQRKIIQSRYNALIKLPMGRYALIDYLNFKGAGLQATQEAYKGKGWALRQVLMHMSSSTKDPLKAFAQSAREVLEQRVKNAPSKNEERWLPGWLKRISTYELPSLA